jgi:uracil-DNA glycosylase family 4
MKTKSPSNNVPIVCLCNKTTVPPSGPTDAPILIVGEFPGWEETKARRPFCGPSGNVLAAELRRIDVSLYDCRVTNLALHMNPTEECYKFGLEQVIKEAAGRRAILLLGSECAKVFVGANVSTISGLVVESQYLSAPLIMCTYNPAAVISGMVGEFRLALQKFIVLYKKGQKN